MVQGIDGGLPPAGKPAGHIGVNRMPDNPAVASGSVVLMPAGFVAQVPEHVQYGFVHLRRHRVEALVQLCERGIEEPADESLALRRLLFRQIFSTSAVICSGVGGWRRMEYSVM